MTAVLPTTTTLNNFFQTAPTSTTSTTSTSTSSAPTKESTIPITNSGSVAGVQLLQALLRSVRGLQTAYGNRNELATDADARVARLCDLWDSVLCHGLRRPAAGASNPAANATTVATALLQTVADRLTEAVTGQTIGTAAANSHHTSGVHFWTFALPHLTAHERERFSTLQNVASDYGRGRALLRAALNERSLERYVLVWLNAAELPDAYEPWAVMRDPEATNLLPSIAAGLGTILFAVLVDNGALNERIAALAELREHLRPEPIIVAPPPATRVKAGHARRRHLVSFGEESTDNEAESAAAPIVGSPGRTLSSMCLKQEDGSVVSSGNRADVVPPVEIFRRLDAVFDVQPELPSEIVEVWGPVDNVRSLEDVHPIEANLDLSANVEGNNNMPFYELVSEHDELIDYQLATQQAEHDDEGNSDPMLGDTNNTMPSASSVEDLAEHTTSSSSVHTEPMTDSGDGNGQSVVELLKERLHYLTERCVQLENRVAGLSLENHRLRGMCNAPVESAHFGLSIPRVYLDRSARKPYYVYEVRVAATASAATASSTGERRVEWTVLRRYSDFYELHRKFRQQSAAVKALDFPPKKHFGNMDTNFVELRRQRLQVYIRHFFAVVPESRVCATRDQLEQVMPFFRR